MSMSRVAHDVASMLDRVNRAPFELRLEGLSSFGGKQAARDGCECRAVAER